MLWVLIAAWFALPAAAHEIPESTRTHLQFLEATAARLEREGNTGKQYEKVKGEIARIRREYQLGAASSRVHSGAKPNWEDFTDARSRAKAADDARAQAERRARAEAEYRARNQARQNAEAKARAEAENRARSEAQEEQAHARAADESLRLKPRFSKFYESRSAWLYAYVAQMQFAERPIHEGGLGFTFAEADSWVKRMLELRAPEEIAAFRRRYEKALAYLRLPAQEGGPAYVRAQARRAALEKAKETTDAQLDQWIAESRQKILSGRGEFFRAKEACPSWFREFGR